MTDCNCKCIDFYIEEEQALVFDIHEVTIVDHNPYEGPYNVIPKWEEQRLATKNKSMRDDVTVEEIPLYKTTNPSGGKTVIIGG